MSKYFYSLTGNIFGGSYKLWGFNRYVGKGCANILETLALIRSLVTSNILTVPTLVYLLSKHGGLKN